MSVRVTLLRTSCLLIEHAGATAITDPWFGRSMRGLPVFRKPGIPLDRLPRIDYVFASHLHPDHFDRHHSRPHHSVLRCCNRQSQPPLEGVAGFP